MFHVKQCTQPGLRYVTRSRLYFFLLYILYICPAPIPHNQPGWFHSNVSRETYLPSLPGCIPSIIYRLYYVPLPPLRRPGRENCLARASNSSPYLATAPLPRLLLLFHAHRGMDVSRETQQGQVGRTVQQGVLQFSQPGLHVHCAPWGSGCGAAHVSRETFQAGCKVLFFPIVKILLPGWEHCKCFT